MEHSHFSSATPFTLLHIPTSITDPTLARTVNVQNSNCSKVLCVIFYQQRQHVNALPKPGQLLKYSRGFLGQRLSLGKYKVVCCGSIYKLVMIDKLIIIYLHCVKIKKIGDESHPRIRNQEKAI